MPEVSASPKLLTLVAVLMVLAGATGYFLGRGNYAGVNTPLTNSSTQQNSIFLLQTATIQGQVVKIDGKNLTVKNSNNNEQASFETAEPLSITRMNKQGKIDSNSTDFSTIEKDKTVFINLQMFEGKYKITQITYVPEELLKPAAPPPATGSAAPSAR